MAEDLKLSGLKYNIAAAVFFVGISGIFRSRKLNSPFTSYLTALRKYHRTDVPASGPIAPLKILPYRNIAIKLYRPSRWSESASFHAYSQLLI
jgi:hypothetical protein